MNSSAPQFFQDKKDLPVEAELIETVNSSLEELFFIDNPQLKRGVAGVEQKLKEFLTDQETAGVWVYFPWSKKAVHYVSEDLYFKLRTARNRNIISLEEQINYRNTSVGIIGLSVGSAILAALVRSGGPKKLRIADFDEIETTNLNRIQAQMADLGSNKTLVAARGVWELDPFADISIWEKGVDRNNLESFVSQPDSLDVLVDEMDNIELKILARVICKKLRIPVLMATDNGDGVTLDVERFDLDPERPIFHGLLNGDVDESHLETLKDLPYKDWLKLATKIVGPDFLTEKMQDSILEIGKTIAAIPQLGTGASIAGAAMAYSIRRLANKEEVRSGRYIVSLEEKLLPDFGTVVSVGARQEKTLKFMEGLKQK